MSSVEELASQVRDAQYEQTERWLQPHAAHDVARVRHEDNPTMLHFDCYTCRLTFTAAITTYLDRIPQGDYSIEVVCRETTYAAGGVVG